MISVRAYYDGHNYITEDSVTVKPNQKVIITYLDEETPQRPHRTLDEIKQYMSGSTKSVPSDISTVDYIRHLRED